jgi:transposase-like protein
MRAYVALVLRVLREKKPDRGVALDAKEVNEWVNTAEANLRRKRIARRRRTSPDEQTLNQIIG